MRLKHLRLNGFKSFVDNTLIPFPSNLTAIVGPNGCGKSNLIDAVRWVMGESSAKSLRGDAMVDVIFNGASARKASGQASVELLFDNSMGRLEGSFAAYTEIAVKRVVSRDANNHYFLNNQRCRRRDITDLFLGTGAGARSYAIISQGSISQLIDARPEELRTHLEEAAGISKYKARRKETLSRIAHTRENLQRIQDICQQLDTHISRLEQQATNAQLYRSFMQQQRDFKNTVIALKWEQIEKRRLSAQQNLATAHDQIYKLKTLKASLINERSAHEQSHKNKQQQLQALHAQFYQQATTIARNEEALKQHQQQEKNRQITLQQLQHDLQVTQEQIQNDQLSLTASNKKIQACREQRPSLIKALQAVTQQFKEAQHRAKERIETQQKHQQTLQKAMHQLDISRLQLARLQDKKQNVCTRIKAYNNTDINEKLTQKSNHIQALKQKIASVDTKIKTEETTAYLLKNTAHSLQQSHQSIQHQLSKLDEQFQANLRETTILNAEIKSKYNAQTCSETLRQWQHSKKALFSQISIRDKSWQAALEWLLNDALIGVMIDTMDELPQDQNQLSGSGISAFTRKTIQPECIPQDTLAAKVQGFLPNWPVALEYIYLAEDLNHAQARLQTLAPGCSVLTKEGLWLGHEWLKCMPISNEPSPNILALQAQLQTVKQWRLSIEKERRATAIKGISLNNAIDENRNQYHLIQAAITNNKATQKRLLMELEQQVAQNKKTKQNLVQYATDKRLLAEQIEQCNAEIDKHKTQLESAIIEKNNAQTAYETSLQSQSCEHEDSNTYAIQRTRLEKDIQALDFTIETTKQRREQWQYSIERATSQSRILQERMEELHTSTGSDTTITTIQAALEKQLSAQHTLERELLSSQEDLKACTATLEQQQRSLSMLRKEIHQQEHVFQDYQLQENELAVRAQGLIEQLEAQDRNLEKVYALKPAHWDLSFCEESLQKLAKKITLLGAINLAAIEEYQAEKARRDTLEAECQDVSAALITLEKAIAKIDKETTIRMQDTFDAVNQLFQQLFPKLFGGGKAELRLTEENLLEAGIIIMAQPPGKRNSSLQLLSGGEKAMTAVALVFALFQLNPSPFCMLDEVDAPLDDANVGRFCRLVQEMSSMIQFLFITHNKVTMEMAEQLMGVTMREPGVSKVVSVDLKETIEGQT